MLQNGSMSGGASSTQLDERSAAAETRPVEPASSAGVGDDVDRRSVLRRTIWICLGLFGLGRLLLLLTAVGISAVDHLGFSLLLRSWDGKYYMYLTRLGYPTTLRLQAAKPDAFFPLYPALANGLHDITHLPWLESTIAIGWIGGAALVVIGAMLADLVWGPERGRQAAIVLAVFPGSVVSGMVYADPVGLALAAGCLYLLARHRFVLAGVAAFAATLSFSLALAPLVAVAAWLFLVERHRKAIVTAVMAGLGAATFYLYLWAHVGTPLIWFRLERVKWHSHFGVSVTHGTIWALRSDFWAGPITAICLVVSVAGLVVLWRGGAPRSWFVFSGVIFAVSMLDTGTWLTPRLVYAMFPSILALGSRVPKAWTTPVVIVSMVCLCLCLCIYAPQNWVFFNP
jgi:hypothetical protein